MIYFAEYEEGELEKAMLLLKDVLLVTEVKETHMSKEKRKLNNSEK